MGFYKIHSNQKRLLLRIFIIGQITGRKKYLLESDNELNYEKGILEDWVNSALKLMVSPQYCYIKDAKGLDMDTSSF